MKYEEKTAHMAPEPTNQRKDLPSEARRLVVDMQASGLLELLIVNRDHIGHALAQLLARLEMRDMLARQGD